MAQATKFRAHAEYEDGTKVLVFPRSKRTGLFCSLDAAYNAIDRFARRNPNAMRGHVMEVVCGTGEQVNWYTRALR